MLSPVWLFVTPWTLACKALLFMEILQARTPEWVAMLSSRRSSQHRDLTQVFCIAGRFLPSELPGKSKNFGMGSLSFCRGSSWPRNWTRVRNQGLPHCKQILYQLSYKGSSWLTLRVNDFSKLTLTTDLKSLVAYQVAFLLIYNMPTLWGNECICRFELEVWSHVFILNCII